MSVEIEMANYEKLVGEIKRLESVRETLDRVKLTLEGAIDAARHCGSNEEAAGVMERYIEDCIEEIERVGQEVDDG